MFAIRILAGIVALGLLGACETTKTGIPHAGDDFASPPEGMRLLRSGLTRESAPSISEEETMALGASSREFAFALYQQARGEAENLFFSPYSIRAALAMTCGGASGTTKSEMAAALRFKLADERLHPAFNATEQTLAKRKDELLSEESSGQGFALSSTNAFFAEKTYTFRPRYLDLLARSYGAGIYLADFMGKPERERLAINDWVLERTHDRVSDVLPPKSIDESVVFVLVNTIYFKAAWQDKFDPANTRDAPFHAPSGDVTVPMMKGFAEKYARGSDYQALEFPYISPSVRVLFILPDQGALDAVEQRLAAGLFDEARAALKTYSVDFRLPRFRFEASLKLKPALMALGMNEAFVAGGADFSALTEKRDVYIDEVYHKAFVGMNEEGTEAAAATAVAGKDASAPPPAEFILDRPFIFAIYDEPTGQFLFVGRLTAPMSE